MKDAKDREIPVTDACGFVMARLDVDRAARSGAPEAVFAQGKSTAETVAITRVLLEKQGHALVTRASRETMDALQAAFPDIRISAHASAALAGTPPETENPDCWVAITAAGTSDLAVAEEAAFTLTSLGVANRIIADVGVAGIHRLLKQVETLCRARVIIAVAGMEGALPGVVAGLVPAPVIAVPTSVGYGASLGGLSALLGMLNSCSPGITVVNIDNGFGAAVAAARILGHARRAGKAE
jgi:NCAIR mutase (PurE)-related proteins